MLLARCLNQTLPLHRVPLTATVSVLTRVLTTAVLKAQCSKQVDKANLPKYLSFLRYLR